MNRYYLDVNEDLVGVPDEVVVDVGGGRDGGEKLRRYPVEGKQTNGKIIHMRVRSTASFTGGLACSASAPGPS